MTDARQQAALVAAGEPMSVAVAFGRRADAVIDAAERNRGRRDRWLFCKLTFDRFERRIATWRIGIKRSGTASLAARNFQLLALILEKRKPFRTGIATAIPEARCRRTG